MGRSDIEAIKCDYTRLLAIMEGMSPEEQRLVAGFADFLVELQSKDLGVLIQSALKPGHSPNI